MKGKRKLLLIHIFILITFINSTIFMIACNEIDAKTYTPIQASGTAKFKTFIADRGTPKFSFEYPSAFLLRNYKIDTELDFTSVEFTGPIEEEEKGNISYLKINIDKKFENAKPAIYCRFKGDAGEWDITRVSTGPSYNKHTGDAKSAMNWRIDDMESLSETGKINNFQILETNIVDLNGIKGCEVIFSFKELPLNEYPYNNLPIRDKSVSVISRYLYLNNNDKLWEIFLYASASTDKQNKEDYEHVIRTFKFLD